MDRGVTIRYGKNLTNLQQDENISNVATGVYPYWKKSGDDAVLVELPEKIVNAPGSYDFVRIIPLDLTSEFDEQPTADQLRDRAEEYVEENNIGIPVVSLTVSFQPLDQTEEYKDIAMLERVNLCDTVTVQYSELGVSAKAECVKTVYDALKGRYTSIELGDARANIADTIASQEQQIQSKPSSSDLQQQVNALTSLLLGANGGSVRILDTNNDGMPDTLYIADNPDPSLAVQVWRFNYEGWGVSTNGYNGPFVLGASIDTGMFADFITTGTLTANLIKAGVLTDKSGNFSLNMDTGELNMQSGNFSGNINGATINGGQFTTTNPANSAQKITISGGSILGTMEDSNGTTATLTENATSILFQLSNGNHLFIQAPLGASPSIAMGNSDNSDYINISLDEFIIRRNGQVLVQY